MVGKVGREKVSNGRGEIGKEKIAVQASFSIPRTFRDGSR